MLASAMQSREDAELWLALEKKLRVVEGEHVRLLRYRSKVFC